MILPKETYPEPKANIGQEKGDFGFVKRRVQTTYIKQITCHLLKENPTFIDLNISSGTSLIELQLCYKQCTQTGLSSSQSILNSVSQRMRDHPSTSVARLIRFDINESETQIEKESADCILMHFMYTRSKRSLLHQICISALKPDGILSLVTNTQHGLLQSKSLMPHLIWKLFSLQHKVNQLNLPINHDSHISETKSLGFQILEHCTVNKNIEFRSYCDVLSWATDSSWTSEYFSSYKKIKLSLLFCSVQLLKIFKPNLFPINAQTDISIILARKP